MLRQPDSTRGDEKAAMRCLLCGSEKQTSFVSEINVHLSGTQNIGNPGVLFLPAVLVCLDCGFSRFMTPKGELEQLAGGQN
jgi:hypothetical protein